MDPHRAATRNPSEPAMMANSSDENADETTNAYKMMQDDDNKTVRTKTVTTKMAFIEQEMTEYTIRYEIPFCEGRTNKNN
jgi:hypothetical protein